MNIKEKKCVKQAIAAKILANQQYVKRQLSYGRTMEEIKSDFELQGASLTDELPVAAPSDKTLSALWEMYGLDNYRYDPHQQLELLKRWVITLYGEHVTQGLKIQNRFDKILKEQSDIRAACDANSVGITRVYFHPMIDDLISGISRELPHYD